VSVAVFLLVASAAFAGSALGAPTSKKVPGNFALVTSNKGGRCYWGIGVEFPRVPGAVSYTINYFDGLSQQPVTGSVTASTIAPGSGLLSSGLAFFGITGGGGLPPCPSDVTEGGRFLKKPTVLANFPGKPPKDGAITGTILDQDHSPVAGVTVEADGTVDGHAARVAATSGPGGLYYATVPVGSWHLVPSFPSFKKATFAPSSGSASVTDGSTATVDFELDAGVQVSLSFEKTSVVADGFEVVKGTITTSQYGEPDPNVTVDLSPMPLDPSSALTTAPRATVCGSTGRVWPTGTLSEPHDVATVTTDASGTYPFTITVGTVPGTWSLGVSALDARGAIMTATSASTTASVTFTAWTPSGWNSSAPNPFNTFIDNINLYPTTSTTTLEALTNDPGEMTSTLAGLLHDKMLNTHPLGGFAFAETNGKDGSSMLVYGAADPPTITSAGAIDPTGGNGDDLVIDPAELSALKSGYPTVSAAIQAGHLPDPPTLREWSAGVAPVTKSAWLLKPNAMTVSSENFQWFGWAYPGITTTGACY